MTLFMNLLALQMTQMKQVKHPSGPYIFSQRWCAQKCVKQCLAFRVLFQCIENSIHNVKLPLYLSPVYSSSRVCRFKCLDILLGFIDCVPSNTNSKYLNCDQVHCRMNHFNEDHRLHIFFACTQFWHCFYVCHLYSTKKKMYSRLTENCIQSPVSFILVQLVFKSLSNLN